MAQNDASFTGSIPQLYDRHMAALLFEPYAADLVARLSGMKAGEVLETATGTGIVTEALVAKLPPAVRITATDLNQPMLDHAATKPGLGRVRFEKADAQALPFPDAQFDAVVCQFGVMFFPNRVQGFREARRVLKLRGRLLFNVWDRLAAIPIFEATIAGLSRRYPKHPSWFLERTPCGYHDPKAIRADLRSAGFNDCAIDKVALTGHAPDARGPAIGLCQGSPMSAEIEALEPGGLERATEAAASAIAERFGNEPFEPRLQALVVEARK
jgi:SAM-dependent methyltransferase